jgi:hypothetical protein
VIAPFQNRIIPEPPDPVGDGENSLTRSRERLDSTPQLLATSQLSHAGKNTLIAALNERLAAELTNNLT